MTNFLNPTEVLKNLELRENMTAADFGSGGGGWVIPLAERLVKGKVYAIDILEEPISALQARIKSGKISNIKTIRADVEKGTELPDNSCDLVLMTNLLFQVEDIKNVLEEGKRILKTEGRILAVDWKKTAAFGPEKRVSREEIAKIAEEMDFKIEKEFEAGIYHWGLVSKKKG